MLLKHLYCALVTIHSIISWPKKCNILMLAAYPFSCKPHMRKFIEMSGINLGTTVTDIAAQNTGKFRLQDSLLHSLYIRQVDCSCSCCCYCYCCWQVVVRSITSHIVYAAALSWFIVSLYCLSFAWIVFRSIRTANFALDFCKRCFRYSSISLSKLQTL